VAERLTIDQAAAHNGLSTRTVRRRIKVGTLPAEREETPQGYRYWVLLEDLDDRPGEATEPSAPAPDAAVVEQLREENGRL
jgi:hypothetical protein